MTDTTSRAEALAWRMAERVVGWGKKERELLLLPFATAIIEAEEALERNVPADPKCERSIDGCAHENLHDRCARCHGHAALARLRALTSPKEEK